MDFIPESTAKMSRDRVHIITTGKRMDHQTPCSSFGLVETSSSSYSGGGGGGCMSSEEEEDMANCLIMLAYSDKPDLDHSQKTNKLKLRSVTEMTTTLGGNSSLHNYECKTCNRAFPSFQALGGHRASHKKPKITIEDKNLGSIKTEFSKEDQPEFQIHYEENKIVTTSNNKKGKIHECSICGSEFLSGQALGGHMRRHRAPLPSANQMINDTNALHNTEKSQVLSIDLNLPAPEVVDDVHSSNHFTATSSSSQRPLVFSTVALVDCHY